MRTPISGRTRSSAGCRYGARIYGTMAATGTIEGPLLYYPRYRKVASIDHAVNRRQVFLGASKPPSAEIYSPQCRRAVSQGDKPRSPMSIEGSSFFWTRQGIFRRKHTAHSAGGRSIKGSNRGRLSYNTREILGAAKPAPA